MVHPSPLLKTAKALSVSVADLFPADEVFNALSSNNKTLMEKISLIDSLTKKEKQTFFTMLDAVVNK